MIVPLNRAIASMFGPQEQAADACHEYVQQHGVPPAVLFSQLFVRILYTHNIVYDSSWWVYNIHASASRHSISTIRICRPWPTNESFDTYLDAIAGITVIVSTLFARAAGMSSGEISKYAHTNWRTVARLLRSHMSDFRQILCDHPHQHIVSTNGINTLVEKMHIH